MNQQCPKCANVVEGKPEKSFTQKLTGKIIEKGGLKIAGNVASLVVGGPAAAAAVTVAEARYEKEINTTINNIEEKLFTEETQDYEFCCPSCGHSWVERGRIVDSKCLDPVKDRFSKLTAKTKQNSLFSKFSNKKE